MQKLKWHHVNAAQVALTPLALGTSCVTVTMTNVYPATGSISFVGGNSTYGTAVGTTMPNSGTVETVGSKSWCHNCTAINAGIASGFVYMPADASRYTGLDQAIANAWSRDMNNLGGDLKRVIGVIHERHEDDR
jgi:hypothetical protein